MMPKKWMLGKTKWKRTSGGVGQNKNRTVADSWGFCGVCLCDKEWDGPWKSGSGGSSDLTEKRNEGGASGTDPKKIRPTEKRGVGSSMWGSGMRLAAKFLTWPKKRKKKQVGKKKETRIKGSGAKKKIRKKKTPKGRGSMDPKSNGDYK